MKSLIYVIGATALAAVLGAGCGESQPAAPAAESPGPPEVVEETPVEDAEVEETVVEVEQAANEVVQAVRDQADELLTQAQALVDEKKYEEASSLLQKLSEIELTPEQQQTLDNLKAAIQKALQSGAVQEGTKAIGNLLRSEDQ